MAQKLYVGGLPFSTTDSQLNEMFAAVGQVVSAKVVTDKYTGQSRGFGFVEMADAVEAEEAIKKLNGSSVGGRTIMVNVARPPEERTGGGGGRRNFGGNRGGGFGGGGRDRGFGGGKGGFGGGKGGRRDGGDRW